MKAIDINNKWNFEDPEVRKLVEEVKWEIAREIGVTIPRDGYWGHTPSRQLGQLGSQLQKRVHLLLEWKKKNGEKKRN